MAGSSPFRRLKERKLVQWALAYLAGAFVVFQGVEVMAEPWKISQELQRLIHVLLLMGLLVTLVLGWYHGERGSQRVTPGEILLLSFLLGITALLVPIVLRPESDSPLGQSELNPARIAVLYFDDHSPDRTLEFLADGLTEGLIHQLSQVGALDVVSRNGVKLFRDGEFPLDSIVSVLQAGSLVEGSVQRSGDQMRVTVQLIDGATGSHLMSRILERPWGELFALQDSLAEEVSRSLRHHLGAEIQFRRARIGTESVEAWQTLQKAIGLEREALALFHAGDTAAFVRQARKADSLYRSAEEADPGWPEPIVKRGWFAGKRAKLGEVYPDAYDHEWIEQGIMHADRALALDPSNAPALELKGILTHFLSYDPASEHGIRAMHEAEQSLRKAVSEDPTRALAWAELGELLRRSGEFQEAKLAVERALEEDAFLENALEVVYMLATISTSLGQHDEALRWTSEGERRFPKSLAFPGLRILVWSGRGAPIPQPVELWEAFAPIEKGLSADQSATSLMIVAQVLARIGLADSAKAVAERAREAGQGNEWIPYYEAGVNLSLGDEDGAIDLLGEFLETRPQRIEFIKEETDWAPLHHHPRFQALLERYPDKGKH